MARGGFVSFAAPVMVAILGGAMLVTTPAAAAAAEPATFYVAVDGDDASAGTSSSAPFATVERAQEAVRSVNHDSDVIVIVGDGRYEIAEPLVFRTADGGQGDHSVTWRAAADAEPVISGGKAVVGWNDDDGDGIWQAPIDSEFDFRQLYVEGAQATRASVEVDANRFTWSRSGFSIDAAYLSGQIGTIWAKLAALSPVDQRRVELRSRGSFTDRYAPFLSIEGTSATMRQPSWDNNTWGWDTIDKPLPNNDHRTLRIQNAFALIDTAGEWFHDINAGSLHYKPKAGVDPNTLEIIAPAMETLMSVSGDGVDDKVANLHFEGLSFAHVSSLRPSSDEGFANQQNGTFITGRIYALVDPVTGDLPTSDQRVFTGVEQAPSVRVIRLGDDGVHRYADDGSAVNVADLPRLINMRDYPNLPLNSSQLATWNAAHPSAQKVNCALPTYPSDCIGFESFRSFFEQSSAAVQVSAAVNVSFERNTFAHLGATALGVGNDSAATLSGVGLGTENVSVIDNSFHDLAATAISAGGIEEEAHHPTLAGNLNAGITISDNRIRDIGKDHYDVSGILITFFDGAEIVHNELSKGPYDAIDSGWAWGIPDAGGNPAYQGRGAYLFSKRYANDDPTINRNVHIAHNVMWDFKQQGSDGGILYNLGATPGSSWDSNYVIGADGYKLYFDEGTRYMTAKNNVLTAGGTWTFANAFTDGAATPSNGQPNTTRDNTVDGTWVLGGGLNQGPWCYDSGACDPNGDGRWNNRITTRSQIGISEFPLDAQRVIAQAGIRPEYRRDGDRVGEPRGLDLSLSRDESGSQLLAATIENLGSTVLSDIALTATPSAAVGLEPVTQAPATLAPGETGTAVWRITGNAAITDGSVSVSAAMTEQGSSQSVKRSLPVVLGGPVEPGLSTAGFSTYLSPQAVQDGRTIAVQSSGRDIGNAGDEYSTVYAPDGLSEDGSVTVKINAVEGAFYRTGLAVRNDLSRLADAAVAEKSTGYATLVAEPGWVAFRFDQNGDGVIDTQVAQAGVSARPIWLRIVREENTLTGWYSTDGTAFTQLSGTVALVGADAGVLDAGVLHSSADRTSVHARAALTTSTATFSDLTFTNESTAPVITSGRPNDAVVGEQYSFALTATRTSSFAVVDGALPAGLNLAEDGKIEGEPTEAGVFSATVEARGAGGAATQEIRIIVRDVAPAAPAVVVSDREATVPALATGAGVIDVRNEAEHPAAYEVTVTDAAGATVHSTELTVDSGATASTRAARLKAGSYLITVVGDDGSPEVTTEMVITDGTFSELPEPWKSGQPGGATSQSLGVDGDQIAIIRQRSNDISGENSTKTDSYSSVYRSDVLGANDFVQVTVTGQERVSDFTKTGIVIRDDLSVSTAGSSGASNGTGTSSGFAALVVTPTRGIRFTVENSGSNWYPIEVAATTPWNVAQTITTPVTLRLTRENGTTLVASYSIDGGATFQPLGSRAGFFTSKPQAALDAGVGHVANGGLQGPVSTAGFRDLLFGADIVAPGLSVAATAPANDGAGDGAATATLTNPTSRDAFMVVTATRVVDGSVVFRAGTKVDADSEATMTIPRLDAGDYAVTARDERSGAVGNATVTIDAAEAIEITPSVATRCVAGKVHLYASVRNDSSGPISVTISTVYGTKSLLEIPPGKTVAVPFNTRLGSIPTGVADFAATSGDGASVSVPVAYAAAACR